MVNLIFVKTTDIDDNIIAQSLEDRNRISGLKPSASLYGILHLSVPLKKAAELGGWFLEQAGWHLKKIDGPEEIVSLGIETYGLSADQVIQALCALEGQELSGPPQLILAEALSGTPLPSGLSQVAALSEFARECSPEITLTRRDIRLSLGDCVIKAVFGGDGFKSWSIKDGESPEITSARSGANSLTGYLTALKNFQRRK